MADEPLDSPPTIAQLPFFVSGRFPRADLVGQCRGDTLTLTGGREMMDRVRDLSLGLGSLGMARGDRVVLLSENRPDWLFADFAIQAAGAVTVPIYPTLSSEQIGFILRDSGAKLAVVSTPLLYERLLAASPDAGSLAAIVVMDPRGGWSPPPDRQHCSLSDVIERGHRRILDGWGTARVFHDEAKNTQPGDLATVIYTSGTTGEPKGVMLTHANLVANLAGVRAVLKLDETDTGLSFLPLCHAFERLVAYIYLTSGMSIVFAESFNTIARDLLRVRPTIVTGVPKLFEKLHARVRQKGAAPGGVRKWIFDRSVRLAAARGRALEGQGPMPLAIRLQTPVADRLVFSRIRDGFGGRLRFAVSGGAPLRPDIGRFFHGTGVPILEGYGLTETSPVLTVMPVEAVRFGTVGRALPGVDLRIADDGEVLARGPNVMAGYYRRPDATAEAIRDGWFHTGDIGALDADGYLRITDRKKELIVTSGGKKAAPQPIEGALRKDPAVGEAVLIGEGREYLSVLIVPDFAELERRLGAQAVAAGDRSSFLDRADVRALFQRTIDQVNVHLAQFERIKRFALLAREFSPESGELTPTLKMKRRVIEEKYKHEIAALYSEGERVRG